MVFGRRLPVPNFRIKIVRKIGLYLKTVPTEKTDTACLPPAIKIKIVDGYFSTKSRSIKVIKNFIRPNPNVQLFDKTLTLPYKTLYSTETLGESSLGIFTKVSQLITD